MKTAINVFGWLGVLLIVTAYTLVSFAVLSPTTLIYQLLNSIGAIGIIVDSFYKKDYQPGVLNVIWALIAIFAIIKIVF